MQKVDLKKTMVGYVAKQHSFSTVVLPTMNYLMIDGKGDPNTSAEYISAIETLYPVAYALKFMVKKSLEIDYGVMPLEGLWWMKDMSQFSTEKKDQWLWTAMILQPDFITKDMVELAIAQVKDKKNPGSIGSIRFEPYPEGRVAQVLYVGPYKDEGPTIQELHAYIKAEGGELSATNLHHHEIYLGDPRRTDPSKLKTIIRQPF